MNTMRLIHRQTASNPQTRLRKPDFLLGAEPRFDERKVVEFPVHGSSESGWKDACWPARKGEFFQGLSSEALSDYESLTVSFCCPGGTVLIREEQNPSNVLFLLEGKVNLSMNSIAGKRLILGIAGPGEILGLTAAISGQPSEIQAQARYPCRIESLHRQDFVEFLMRHPVACQNVTRELSLNYTRACERLRILGLASTAQTKLARLLLEWCTRGQTTESGTQIRCLLTHEEIGEYIGASRETVTRTLNKFKNRDLVELRGSSLLVNRKALANYTGLG
jgi:CRP/FNR family transcriptional regulator